MLLQCIGHLCMQSEGSSYKVTIFKNSEKSIGLHPLQSGIRNERVNSQPIFQVDAMCDDGPTALTPGHFIIGRPLKAFPTRIDSDSKISVLKRWNLVAPLQADLWCTWRSRYLQHLQGRDKWMCPTRNFQVGDIVLLKDETLKSRTWPLARVVNTYPGNDQLTRVVDVHCKGKIYRRAINRLVLNLPSCNKQTCAASRRTFVPPPPPPPARMSGFNT